MATLGFALLGIFRLITDGHRLRQKAALNLPSDTKSRLVEFVIKDYDLKQQFLIKHYERMLTRFNYLTTLELALFAGVGFAIKEQIAGAVIYLLSAAGLVLSSLWFIVAWQDRSQVEEYRDHIRGAMEMLMTLLHAPDTLFSKYQHVGKPRSPKWIKIITITRLPFWVAAGFAFIWIILFAFLLKRPDLLVKPITSTFEKVDGLTLELARLAWTGA